MFAVSEGCCWITVFQSLLIATAAAIELFAAAGGTESKVIGCFGPYFVENFEKYSWTPLWISVD